MSYANSNLSFVRTALAVLGGSLFLYSGSSVAQEVEVEFALPDVKGPDVFHEALLLKKLLRAENERSNIAEVTGQALKHPSPKVIIAALRLLGRVGNLESLPQIISFLEHSEASVRKNAAFAIGLIGSDTSAEILKSKLSTEQNDDVKVEVF